MAKNIYNYNKTRFQMRVAEMVKIIIKLKQALYLKLVQFENTEWVIIIERINVSD